MAANDNSAVTSAVNQQHRGPYDDPVYKKLSRINGDINKMTKDEMKEKLANLHLDTRCDASFLSVSLSIGLVTANLPCDFWLQPHTEAFSSSLNARPHLLQHLCLKFMLDS